MSPRIGAAILMADLVAGAVSGDTVAVRHRKGWFAGFSFCVLPYKNYLALPMVVAAIILARM